MSKFVNRSLQAPDESRANEILRTQPTGSTLIKREETLEHPTTRVSRYRDRTQTERKEGILHRGSTESPVEEREKGRGAE